MRGVEQIPWLYDAICAFAEWRGLDRWRRWLVDGARGRTLDLGCGTGRNLPLFPPPYAPWASIRPPRRCARAPPGAGAPLVQGSAEALPFRDGCFDTVVSGLVLCSVPDPALGLAEVRRVLRPEGSLRALEHVRATTAWQARMQDALQPAWTWLTGGCHPNRDTERAVEARRLRDRRRRPARAGQPPPLRGPASGVRTMQS